jgi:two-component sensor histidine kinase
MLLLCVVPGAGQNINRQMVNGLLSQLRKSQADESRINMLTEIGKFHIFKAGEAKHDLDSGFVYLQQARRLSDSLHLVKWQHETESMMVIGTMESGDTVSGKARFDQLMNECRKTGDKATEAVSKLRMGVWLNARGKYSEVMDNYNGALTLCREIKDREGEIRVLREIASIHINQGKIQEAEDELLNVLEQYKSINYPKLHYTYNFLSTVSRIKGDFDKGLFYAIQCIESMEKTRDTLSAANFYGDLARIYYEIGNREKSIEWYRKSLEKWRQEGLPNFAMFTTAGFIMRDLIAQHNAGEALSLMDNLRRQIPPITFIQKACIAQNLAYCYDALQEYPMAEKYYLETLKWYQEANMDFEVSQQAKQDIGKFYLERKDFKKAGLYLREALSYYPQKNAVATIMDIHYMLYKVDSAEKDYASALNHFREYKLLSDSIFTSNKSRQIEELQIQYATKENKKDIEILNNQSRLQRTELKQANLTKNVTFAGIALLLVIIALLYNQYRTKYRNNKKLELQQKEIQEKNISLESLLEEKEWLLKEVHHRVKNNLHTVMSLLESQSAYLENDALRAIRDSQHRVYAMSLLHQKLYQTDSVSSINMTAYLPELVNYLRESFEGSRQLRFHTEIAQIELDISQAVPIGLILNEAVTNSMKYAFPDNSGSNEIAVVLQKDVDGMVELIISDNGVGLPAGFDSNKSSGLGLKLIKGLTEDIHGEFYIHGDNGTELLVRFMPVAIAEEPHHKTLPKPI